MYKDKGTIEEKFPFNTFKGETQKQVLEAIHQIRQDDLNAIKDMIFCNQPIYEKLKPNQILNEIIKYLDNLKK